MRKLLITTLLIFGINAFAQKSFVFDYCYVYDFKETEDSLVTIKRYILSNASDEEYFVCIDYNLDSKIAEATLYDIKNKAQFYFPNKNQMDLDSVSIRTIFNNPIRKDFDLLKFRKQKQHKYDVVYQNENGNRNIILKRYKDKKKKKLVGEMHFAMESHPEIRNQFYINPLVFSYKFDTYSMQVQGYIVKDFYYIESKTNKKEHIWKLTDSHTLELFITIPTI
ncbi:MAG: hypothetical protein WCY89_07820 [Flavobacteriaceae bacterium]